MLPQCSPPRSCGCQRRPAHDWQRGGGKKLSHKNCRYRLSTSRGRKSLEEKLWFRNSFWQRQNTGVHVSNEGSTNSILYMKALLCMKAWCVHVYASVCAWLCVRVWRVGGVGVVCMRTRATNMPLSVCLSESCWDSGHRNRERLELGGRGHVHAYLPSLTGYDKEAVF